MDMERAAEILQSMAAKGLRITEQRKTMVQLFIDRQGYLAAKDLYTELEKVYPGLSFDTVYRNLRLLVEMHVLESVQFDDGSKFRISCGDCHEHHHHFICTVCEATFPYEVCPVDLDVPAPQGFKITNHKFEIYGLCASCQPSEGSA